MNANEFTGFSAIAVTLDGSALASSAMPIVAEMARKFHARVILITVLDESVGERFADFCRAEGVDLMTGVHTYQDKLVADLRQHDVAAAGHVVPLRHPSTEETILEVAENLNASLLVIGSHGRSGIKRAVLGSVAEGLIREGNLPVMVLRPETAETYASL